MKKYSLIIMFILVQGMISMAQEPYQPFVVEGKTWNMSAPRWSAIIDTAVVCHTLISGDTVINGHTCKKIHWYWDKNNHPNAKEAIYVGALYEDKGEVHYVWPEGDSICLVYDFNVQAGDTVHQLLQLYALDMGVQGKSPLIVDAHVYSIDTVADGNHKLRIFALRPLKNSRLFYWIDGVGSYYDFIQPQAEPGGSNYILSSCSIGNDTIYDHKDYSVLLNYMIQKQEEWSTSSRAIMQPVGNHLFYLHKKSFPTIAMFHSLVKDEADVTIPATVSFVSTKYKVTSIDTCAFRNSGIQAVILPNTVDTIYAGAFRDCHSLASVKMLSYHMRKIYSSVFSGCSALRELRCAALVPPEVAEDTFEEVDRENCILYVPMESSLELYRQADGWKEFRHMEVDYNIGPAPESGSLMIGKYRYKLDTTAMTAVLTSVPNDAMKVDVPAQVTYRGGTYTVKGMDTNMPSVLTEAVLPNTMEDMGKYAFSGCGELTTVTLPTSLKSVGEYTFYGCTALKEVQLPEGVTAIGDNAFKDCTGLSNILLPENLLSIGNRAFQGCTALKELQLSGRVAAIGDNAFKDCTGLSNILLPESVESIGSYAFSGCAGLKDMDLPDIRSIGNGAFAGCQELEKVLLGDGLTSIEDETFKGCSSLQDIVLPARLAGIGNSSFSGCTSLREILIPDRVTSIGDNAFEECSGMKKVTIGKSVQCIPYRCFCDCSNLSTVVNNSLSADIYMYAFRNCPLLKEITITGDTIQYNAFWKCSGLEKVIFTQNVKYLGNRAFRYCGNIKEVFCRAVEPPAMDGTVFDVTSVAYVPTEESLQLYKSSSYQWQYFDLRVEQGTDGIRAIGNPQGGARGFFNLWGQRQNQPLKGVNIIRKDDGTTRKVLVK